MKAKRQERGLAGTREVVRLRVCGVGLGGQEAVAMMRWLCYAGGDVRTRRSW